MASFFLYDTTFHKAVEYLSIEGLLAQAVLVCVVVILAILSMLIV